MRSFPRRPSLLALLAIACGCSRVPARPAAVESELPLRPSVVAVQVPPSLPSASEIDPEPSLDLATPRTDFLRAWPQIQQRLRTGRPEVIDELVEPNTGLYVFDNPGATVEVTNHPSYTSAFAGRGYSPEFRECDLRPGVLPEYSCETESYSAEGCVHTHAPPPTLVTTAEWTLRNTTELSEAEVQKELAPVRDAQALITDSVSDTRTGTRWYFGSLRGRWWLVVVDIVTPCSA